MEQKLKIAIEFQERARGASTLAMKYLFSVIDGTDIKFMGHPENVESKMLVALINQSGAYVASAAARLKMGLEE